MDSSKLIAYRASSIIYAWNNRELALLTLIKSLAEGGLEPFTMGDRVKHAATELSEHFASLSDFILRNIVDEKNVQSLLL